MRVLQAVDFYRPFIGGAERLVELTANELTRRTHSVAVATVWHSGLSADEMTDGVQVFRLKGVTTSLPWFSKDPARRFHPPFPDPGIVLGLRRVITRFRPEVVHANGWIAYSCAVALMGTDIPLVVSARDYGYTCATRGLLFHGAICEGPAPRKCLECAGGQYGTPKAMAAVAAVFAGRPLLNHQSTLIHSVSHYVDAVVKRDLLPGTKPVSAVVIPDFLAAETDLDRELGEQYAKRLPAEPFILFVGALTRHKGLQQVLEAYQRLHSPPPLVLIGTPWPETPKTFPPGVVVLTNVPHYGVMAAWERCLFGLGPSLWPEPFGNVLMEGMSQGKAVIGSRIGGHADTVLPGTGLLVQQGDVEALRAAMQGLLKDSELRDRLGAAARERVQALTAGAIIPRFEALYTDLIARSRLARGVLQ